MKTKVTPLLVAVAVGMAVTTFRGQSYRIDPGHSNVQIQVERFGVVDVIGRFKDVVGTITYTDDDMTKTLADASIKVVSYDANNLGGEKAVTSEAFLDAKTYPEITFVGNSTVIKEDQPYLRGQLTIHGVTQEIELPFTIKGPLPDLPTKKQSIAFNATTVVNRQDYGISFNHKLPNGTPLVGDEVKITLAILALAE